MTSKIPDSNAQLSFLPFCPNEIIPSKFGATKEPCGYDFGFPEILQFFFLVVNTVAIIVAGQFGKCTLTCKFAFSWLYCISRGGLTLMMMMMIMIMTMTMAMMMTMTMMVMKMMMMSYLYGAFPKLSTP